MSVGFFRRLGQSLGRVFGGTAAGALLALGGMVLLARLVGAEEFGRYFVIVALANLLLVGPGYGLAAAVVHYGSRFPSSAVLRRAGRQLVWLMPVAALVTILAARTGLLPDWMQAPKSIAVTLILTLAMAVYLLVEAEVKAQTAFRFLAAVRFISGAAFLVSIVALSLWVPAVSAEAGALARALPYAAVAVAAFGMIRRGSPRNYVDLVSKRFGQYAAAAAVGTSTSVLLHYLDKLVLADLVTASDLGIYSAHFVASYLIAGRLGEVVNAVVFPQATEERVRHRLVGELLSNGWIPVLAIASLTFGTQSLAFWFLGDAFPFRPALAALFALGAGLYVVADVSWWVTGAGGLKPIQWFALAATGVVALLVAGVWILAPRYGLIGAAVALLGATFLSAVLAAISARRTLTREEV